MNMNNSNIIHQLLWIYPLLLILNHPVCPSPTCWFPWIWNLAVMCPQYYQLWKLLSQKNSNLEMKTNNPPKPHPLLLQSPIIWIISCQLHIRSAVRYLQFRKLPDHPANNLWNFLFPKFSNTRLPPIMSMEKIMLELPLFRMKHIVNPWNLFSPWDINDSANYYHNNNFWWRREKCECSKINTQKIKRITFIPSQQLYFLKVEPINP